MYYKTDISENRQLCLKCELLNDRDDLTCKQCGSTLHQRKPYSLALTWNYTIVAMLFLIPANLLPMMIITKLGIDEGNTIMEGIIYFVKYGEMSIGIIIFIASIAVPIFKIGVLLLLLAIVHFKLHNYANVGIRLYRIIERIGKWSLLDIFVVAIMIAMVQFQNLATVNAGGAAFTFALAVILTMLATESFDPRLMFDFERRKQDAT
ncbi:MAG: paraquat-inducible protein A [Campylobacterota bacterium]|nr:paraquat-inducible protein A [Campylobacterota bacterium]